MIIKARKKPIEIEAIIWDGCRWNEICDFCENKVVWIWAEGHKWDGDYMQVSIPTLEGTMVANIGDYIIRGVKGEYYPCKPDVFKATYDILPHIN